MHIGLTILPIDAGNTLDQLYLILINEIELNQIIDAPFLVNSSNLSSQLEAELLMTKEQLNRTIEQNETSSEELKASNEELQAINEELRSTSEELEISKEELQSINEELITVNHELKIKVDETGKSNDDLQNFIAASEIATIFVDRSIRIKRFTPHAAEIFNLINSDIGRPLHDITHHLQYSQLETDAASVFDSLRMIEREVSSDNKTKQRLQEEEQRMRLIAASMKDYAIFTFDNAGIIIAGITALNEDVANGFAKIARDLTWVKEEENRKQTLFEQESESKRKMEIAAKMRDEFFAVLSHELKQPLNLININAEMLKRLPESREIPKVIKAAEIIRSAAISQATLINDLLDLSRAQTGKLHLDKKLVDLVPILDRVVQAFQEDVTAKKLNINFNINTSNLLYYADVTRFEQIVWNLLSNAVKFT